MQSKIVKHMDILEPEAVIVTTAWTATSKGLIDFHYDAFELYKALSKSGITKLLIPEDSLETTGTIGTPYKNETIIHSLNDKFQNFEIDDTVYLGKPTSITCKSIFFVDGCLPTKGIINAEKLIIILNNDDTWWAKNIKCYTGMDLELWYDQDMDYPISGLVFSLQKAKPNLRIKLKPMFKGLKPDFENYRTKREVEVNRSTFNYLVWCPSTHTEYYSKDLYKVDRRYQTDILKEIRDIIVNVDHSKFPKPAKLIIAGWNPNYEIDELIYLNKHLDQKCTQDRQLAIKFAEDLSEYIGCEVEVYPECDLPYENLIDNYDVLIYTPSLKNWDVNSRLLYECRYFKKILHLTPTQVNILPNNPGLQRQIERLYKKK